MKTLNEVEEMLKRLNPQTKAQYAVEEAYGDVRIVRKSRDYDTTGTVNDVYGSRGTMENLYWTLFVACQILEAEKEN